MKWSAEHRNAFRRTLPLVGVVALLAALGFLAAWSWSKVTGWWSRGGAKEPIASATSLPTDPQMNSATPYLNVRPEVKYVGDAACAVCHAAISKTYRSHPMARSLTPVTAALAVERYDAAAQS